MRNSGLCRRTITLAFSIALFFGALAAASAEGFSESIAQRLCLEVGEESTVTGVREDNPTNADNWQGRDEWKAAMTADLDWFLGISDRAYFSFKGDMDWTEASGARGDTDGATSGDRSFREKEVLATVNFPELCASAMAGKTMRRYGTAVMMPVTDFLSRDTAENDAPNHGKWMAGISFSRNPVTAELWYAPIGSWVRDEYRYASGRDGVDAMVLCNASILVDVHRAGLVYYHNGSNALGAYYSGQLGECVIPYAECAVSDRPLLASFAPEDAMPRDDGPSLDALLGFSVTPRVGNVTAYVEYRYRSSGVTANEWDDLESALADPVAPDFSSPAAGGPPSPAEYAAAVGAARRAQGSTAAELPYFYTATHAIGARVQNSSSIADCVDYNLNAFYLAPDGLYLKAESTLSALDRLKLIASASAMIALGDKGEMRWWNETWQLSLAARWTVATSE
jgi:hypothetical protein